MFRVQSVCSSMKMSSTGLPNSRAIFSANTVEGTYLFASMALMVCLLTDTLLARSSCVNPFMALCTLILFFIGCSFSIFVHQVIEPGNENDQHGKHVIDHHVKKSHAIYKYKSKQ